MSSDPLLDAIFAEEIAILKARLKTWREEIAAFERALFGQRDDSC